MNLPRVYTCPHPEPPSHLPPHTIPLSHPSAPAPSILYHASSLVWRFISPMIYMFQCHSPKSSNPRPLPESKRLFYISVSLLLSRIQGYCYHLSKFHVYALVYCIGKLEIELPYDPAIPLLGIHTKETRIERDMCTPVFTAALFIIARTWKQPRCPSADEWIRKLWYMYTVEYYSAVKKNTFESVLMRWMKLEPIIHSEVSQKEKQTICF